MCAVQGTSATEQGDSPGQQQAQRKHKSARRSSGPLRTEWSIAALTPRGMASESPQDAHAHSSPARSLPPQASAGAACTEGAAAAGGSQHGREASLAAHGTEGRLAGPEGQSSHAASALQGSSAAGREPLSSSAAQDTSKQEAERSGESSGTEHRRPDQDVSSSQLPGSSPPQTQKPPAAGPKLLASNPLPQGLPAGSNRQDSWRLQLEDVMKSRSMEGSLPSSRQAPVHSPAQHGRHSGWSPSKKPSTSHFSIHVDSRAHVHRYSAAPEARSDSAAAPEVTLPQVCLSSMTASVQGACAVWLKRIAYRFPRQQSLQGHSFALL